VVEQEIVNLFVGGSSPSSGASEEDKMEESKITWTEHHGSVGGFPVKVTKYWEGLYEGKRICWITPQSDGTDDGSWKLSKSGPPSENGYIIRDKNLSVLKETLAKIGGAHE
jgi:hypothetical protein